ncbi:hypothetical protein N0V95_006028 [Ascochyta clinopodiicola]|nr:hypothetical protein N0V95_006028 [Ascochyta clinopodiicola]
MWYRLFEVTSQMTLSELDLRRVPTINTPVTRDPRFTQTMRMVEDLCLNFSKWVFDLNWLNEMRANPQDIPVSKKAHTFMHNLEEWIGQNQANLKRFHIWFEDYVGYYPKLDLRNVYYPRLKVLELSCVTLSHSSQIDWILAHKDTLTTLYLAECPILVHVETRMALDDKLYPIAGEFAANITRSANDMTWHHILTRFRTQLTHLKDYKVYFIDESLYPSEVSGMVPLRYQTYFFGAIETIEVSKRVGVENHEADTEAYVQLMLQTGMEQNTS